MRVLLVAHNFPTRWRAGVESYTAAFAQALARAGVDVSVLYPVQESAGSAPRIESATELGLRVHRLHAAVVDGYGLRVGDPEIESCFASLLAEQRPDVVHFQHTWIALPFSLPRLARESGAAVCLTLHDFWFFCARTHLLAGGGDRLCSGPDTPEKCAACLVGEGDPPPELSAGLALRRTAALAAIDACDVVTTPSEYMRRQLVSFGAPEERIDARPIGIALAEPLAPARTAGSSRTVFGSLGAVSPLKGTIELVQAFHELPGDARLVLAGPLAPGMDGPLAQAIGRDGRIEYVGPYEQARLPEILAGLDVVVIPSKIESFSLVGREAQAAGIPLIAARVGALPELVGHGDNGLLFEPNAPAALVEALRRMCDAPFRARLAARARAPLGIDADARDWLERYRGLRPARAPALDGAARSNPDCSVIVPVFGQAALTRACVTSLLESDERRSFELIVVDDGSTDDTPRVLAGFGDAIRVVSQGRNTGFAQACNAGAASARADRLLFLNNDTEPRPGWLDALLAELDAHPEVAIAGSKLLFPDGGIQHAGVFFSKPYGFPYHPFHALPGNDPRVNRRTPLRAVTGACLMIRRSIFRDEGGFDTGYRNGYEDIDLCLRVNRLGGGIVYQPRSVLVHLGSRSEGRFDDEAANQRLFRERWEDPQGVDEDLRLAAHGLVAAHDASGRVRLEPRALGPFARWDTLIAAQRAALARDLGALARLFENPARWPEDAMARRYASLLCARCLGEEAALRFSRGGSAPSADWRERTRARANEHGVRALLESL